MPTSKLIYQWFCPWQRLPIGGEYYLISDKNKKSNHFSCILHTLLKAPYFAKYHYVLIHLTVSEFNQIMTDIIQNQLNLNQLCISGDITQLNYYSEKALYLTLSHNESLYNVLSTINI